MYSPAPVSDAVVSVVGDATPASVCQAAASSVERGLNPGMQVYASLDGAVVADFAVGSARDGVPMHPGTIVPWLSATKPVVSVLVGRLRTERAIDFEDPVALTVPEFAAAGKGDARVRDLMSHTIPFAADITPASMLLGWDAAVADACALPLSPHGVIGRTARYTSFAAWQVLGEIVRRHTGEPFGEYVRRTLFEPLFMTRSWVGLDPSHADAIADEQCEMHDTRSGRSAPGASADERAYRSMSVPGTGGIGPMRELGRLYEALVLDGAGRDALGIDDETLTLMTTTQRRRMHDPRYAAAVEWGLGFITDRRLFGGVRTSRRVFGHDGRLCALSFADAERRLVVCLMATAFTEPRANSRRFRSVVDAILDLVGIEPLGAKREPAGRREHRRGDRAPLARSDLDDEP